MGSDVAGRRPVLDVYARLSRAYNGETIQVDDQVEVCLEELAERGADAGEVFKDNRVDQQPQVGEQARKFPRLNPPVRRTDLRAPSVLGPANQHACSRPHLRPRPRSPADRV